MSIGDIAFLIFYLGIIVFAVILAIKSEKERKEEIPKPKTFPDFKTQMEQAIIPAIARMIEKEEEHLAELQKFSHKYPEHKIVDIFITRSEQMLHHLKLRHKEYSDYCNTVNGI